MVFVNVVDEVKESKMVKCVSVLMIVLLVLSFLLSGGFIRPAQASIVTISGRWDTVWINSTTHEYCVGNNVWNPDPSWVQELQVDDQTGAFTVTKSNHNNITHVCSYPFIYKGNHWGSATTNSGLPMQVDGLNVETSWNISIIDSGVWNAAYDLWFHKTSDYSGGQFNGAELMIWISYTAKQWEEKKVGTVSLAGATWNVYYWVMTSGSVSWNYIAYLRNSNTTSVNFNLNAFVADAVSRGYIQNSWYLTAVEAGFEIWKGGVGLTSNSFSVKAVRDVAVVSVTPSLTQVGIGEPVNITVMVKNDGSVTETFDVTTYYENAAGNYTIGIKTVNNLAPGDIETLIFTWDTSGIAGGNYTIRAVAETVSGETNTANNEITVKGIRVIPEFPTWALMLLILVTLTIAIAIYKRRLKSQSTKQKFSLSRQGLSV
jgi:hypothetical protein